MLVDFITIIPIYYAIEIDTATVIKFVIMIYIYISHHYFIISFLKSWNYNFYLHNLCNYYFSPALTLVAILLNSPEALLRGVTVLMALPERVDDMGDDGSELVHYGWYWGQINDELE